VRHARPQPECPARPIGRRQSAQQACVNYGLLGGRHHRKRTDRWSDFEAPRSALLGYILIGTADRIRRFADECEHRAAALEREIKRLHRGPDTGMGPYAAT